MPASSCYVACRLPKYAKSARPAKWYIPTPANGPIGLVREVGTQVVRTIPVPTRSDELLSVLVARLARARIADVLEVYVSVRHRLHSTDTPVSLPHLYSTPSPAIR